MASGHSSHAKIQNPPQRRKGAKGVQRKSVYQVGDSGAASRFWPTVFRWTTIAFIAQLCAPRRFGLLLALLFDLALLGGCSSLPSPAERTAAAQTKADAAGWQKRLLDTGRFQLMAFVPAQPRPGKTLTVYIEGDGLAWISSDLPSADPTPVKPTALMLALKHESGPAAYLGRPCQYLDAARSPDCTSAWWTEQRFAPEVVRATAMALDQLKQSQGAERLILVGYSGGGAVAALVAAERNDVVRLVTVAGNLDTEAWRRHHRLSPLKGSQNPADAWPRLAGLPQLHLIGGRDAIMPTLVAQSYAGHFPPDQMPVLRIIDGYDHGCCWADAWPGLMAP